MDKNAICPSCLQYQLVVLDQHDFVCNNCKTKIPIDVYMMSLQLMQKDIIVEALKRFIIKSQQKLGLCVLFNNIKYVIWFDQQQQIHVSQYHGQYWVQGSMVQMKLSKQEMQYERI